MRMNLVILVYLCVAIIPLLPCLIGGRKMNKREKRTFQGQHKEDMRKWQWYLTDTAVSMNVKAAWQAGYTGKGILVAVVDDGVNIDHPDLKSNFNLTASYDFLEDRNISSNYNPASHGTNCAGIIAGANNTKCGMGVAFGAQISSIRLYNDDIHSTDQSEAKALEFRRDIIDIYSNSWGPGDMGFQVEGPGPQLEKTLEEGTRLGRRGKGSIFVFAAGNGGIPGDSCAFSGYVNNIHTIAISGVNWDGSVPAYTEQCAGITAVTYGQDMFTDGKTKPPLITAKGASDCTERFPGTSGTTAMASGIIALALQANPDLTWRDVQHLIARSSKPLNPPRPRHNIYSWVRRPRPIWRNNAAGLTVSSHYGFGLMDAGMMTEYAKKWRSVPKQLSCEVKLNVSSFNSLRLVIPPYGTLRLTLSLNQENCSIRYLEHMQAQVNLQFPRRGHLQMSSTSPSGTPSKLLYSRAIDSRIGYKNFTNWRVTSLHYWGEKPIGDWNIAIRNTRPWTNTRHGRVLGMKLIFYGTEEDPLTNNTHVDRRRKKIETVEINRRRKEIPIHGGYSEWSWWGRCSRTCGGGIHYRYRWCNNPWPENAGRHCSGDAIESRTCRMQKCPVNGGFSPWGSWFQCSVTCGVGYQLRRRTCTNPSPAYGGRNCVGSSVQVQRCRLSECPPVDGGYSDWSTWSQCSVTCNNGTQHRLRSCTNPSPANGGKQCAGPHKETRICKNSNTCPVHGGYSAWGSWSQCSVTCGVGYQLRRRTCTNPAPAYGGRKCVGSSLQTQRCLLNACPPIDGGYSVWSSWSQCSATCNNGTEQRRRSCTNPPPANGGKKCAGPDREIRICKTSNTCPVDGGYSDWNSWSQCSATCNNGTEQRRRSCTNPPPANGGKKCAGPDREIRICKTSNTCPVDGGYSNWSSWSLCSATCNNGTQDRRRSCTNPSPANGGKPCTGPGREMRICENSTTCPPPVDGGYSDWSSWSLCTATCNNGTQQRLRSCTNPPPANGGKQCTGPDKETRICGNSNTCPLPACTNILRDSWCQWWLNHGQCSKQYVKDRCKKTCGNCRGLPIDGGYSQWSTWSPCSRTCGLGSQKRNRSCTSPRPQSAGRDCSTLGQATESKMCNTQRCPVCNDNVAESKCQEWLDKGFRCSNQIVGQECKKTCHYC